MGVEGSGVDVVLLGLSGFRVVAARVVDGEAELTIEPTETVAWCTACGVRGGESRLVV